MAGGAGDLDEEHLTALSLGCDSRGYGWRSVGGGKAFLSFHIDKKDRQLSQIQRG